MLLFGTSTNLIMLELVIGIGITAFILAFIYAKMPEKKDDNDFWSSWLRVFFLLMSLFSLTFLTWVMFSSEQSSTLSVYDKQGNYLGQEVTNTTLATPIKNALSGYLQVWVLIPIIVFAIVVIVLIYNIIRYSASVKEKERGYGSV